MLVKPMLMVFLSVMKKHKRDCGSLTITTLWHNLSIIVRERKPRVWTERTHGK